MREFAYVTTNAAVEVYEASSSVFAGLLSEMRELSKKKPDTTLSKSKVKILNRVLTDIRTTLHEEAEGKYLDLLDDDDLPQNSDAVLVMVQYEDALKAFESRYRRYVEGTKYWITKERLKEWEEAAEDEDDDEYE